MFSVKQAENLPKIQLNPTNNKLVNSMTSFYRTTKVFLNKVNWTNFFLNW